MCVCVCGTAHTICVCISHFQIYTHEVFQREPGGANIVSFDTELRPLPVRRVWFFQRGRTDGWSQNASEFLGSLVLAVGSLQAGMSQSSAELSLWRATTAAEGQIAARGNKARLAETSRSTRSEDAGGLVLRGSRNAVVFSKLDAISEARNRGGGLIRAELRIVWFCW